MGARTLVLAMACLGVAARLVVALPPVAFRLDDVQCGYLGTVSQAIVNAFVRNSVPLTVGVITGPGDCYTTWLKPLVDANAALLEIVSHSHNHISLDGSPTTMPLNYNTEIAVSRQQLRTQFPNEPVDLFIPPFNAWNLTVPAVAKAAGYTKMSVLCSIRSIQPFGASGGPDNACVTNMYPNVQFPFFTPIDGITYIPIGTSTANFFTPSQVVTATNVLSTPSSECSASGICSIVSQLEANANRMQTGSVPFAAVMMHPQEFNVAGYDDAAIATYFDNLLTQAKTMYTLHTLSDLITAVTGGSTTGSSSNTGGTGSSTLTSTGRNAASSSTAGGVVVSALATVAVAWALVR